MRALSLALLVSTSPLCAQSIVWTPSLDDALAKAKAEKKPILLAFNLDGERASDELVADHYKDAAIAKLAERTLNVFCSITDRPRVPGVSAAQHQAAEKKARGEILKIGAGEDVIAPQHVFIDGDGTVLVSAAYRLSKGELEWCFAEAIRKLDPTFAFTPSPRTRAPAALAFGKPQRGETAPPPSKAEVAEALKEVKKGRGGFAAAMEHAQVILRSDDPEALKWGQNTLRGLPGGMKGNVLRMIGAGSPRAWHAVLAEHLDSPDTALRLSAAAGLESIAEPKALPALQKASRSEKDEGVRGRLLRAMAACGPEQKSVVQTVQKAVPAGPEALRIQAILAAAYLDDGAVVRDLMKLALTDAAAKARATAAYVIATRREQKLLADLEPLAQAETDADTKLWLAAAVEVLRGAPPDAFARFKATVLGEKSGVENLLGR